MGTVSATTAITAHETANGFANAALTMTAGGATNAADIRSSSASSGYSGASASANVFFTSTSGSYGFAIEGINASSFTSLTVQFGYRKESATVLPTLALDYWNGSSYVNVPFTFSQAANAAIAWYLSPSISLPVAAQINGLRLRWTKSGTTSVRIDDVVLQGTSASPTISVGAASLPKFYANQSNSSQGQSFTVGGSNLGSNNLTVGPLAGYEFSTSSTFASASSSLSFTPVSGSVSTQTVHARLLASNVVGSYNGNIPVDAAGSGATTQNIAVTGQVYAAGSPFTAGNILTLRVGESSGSALSSTSAPIFMDEYTTTGTFVQSVAMPFSLNALGTNNRRFTMSGSSTSEGYLNLSPDGQFLTFGGYDAAPGIASITSTPSATTNRIVARVMHDASINTTTRIADGYDANNIRSAATVTGDAFWTGGPGGASGGTRYVPLGNGLTATTQISSTITNTRGTAIYNSQLYVSAQSGSNIGISTVGSGLPTNSGNTTTMLTGTTTNVELKNPHGFAFVDQDGNGTPDVMYVADADATNGGLMKFSNTGGTWTARGRLSNPSGRAVYGLTAKVEGSDRRLFLNLGGSTTIATEIYSFLDNSAVTSNIASNGSDIITACGTAIITAPANVGFKGVSFAPVFVPTPTVDHTFTTPSLSVSQGSTLAGLYRVQCDITDGNALLTGITVQTTGSYISSDINNFKLIISTDATLDGTDPVLATINTSSGPGQNLAFTGLGQNLPAGTTRYLFIAASISGCANVGNTIGIASTPLTSITYGSALTIKNGTPAAGNNLSIVLGTLDNVSGLSATSGTPVVPVSWTNPTCVTEVIVVAHTSSIGGTPTGTYTGNTNFALAPAFPGGGKVVYNGLSSPQNITGLTIGQSYFFKVFVRFGANYSSGVEVSATPQLVNIYSRGSGVSHTDAIWSLSPNGTAQTLAAVGGMAADRGLVIQTGHTVQLSTSGGTVIARELVVQSGGTFTATGTTESDNKFLILRGDVTNNGTIGTGTTYSPICFVIDGNSTTISGTGVTHVGRIRKGSATIPTSNLIINSNVNVNFSSDGAIYNNTDNTTFNVTVNAGRVLSLLGVNGGLSVSGTDGLASNPRNGTITINGTVNVGGATHVRSNNIATNAGIVINNGGVLNTRDLLVNTSTGNGFGFTLNGNGTVNVTGLMNNIAGTFTPTVSATSNINISGRLLVTAGTVNPGGRMTIVSTSAGTGMIDGSGAGNVAGSIVVQRFISTPTSSSYRYISNPTTANLTVNQHLGDDFNVWGTPSNYTYSFDPSVPQPSVFPTTWWFNDAQPNYFTGANASATGWSNAINEPMESGKGFACSIPTSTTLDFTGAPANGPISFNVIDADDGFNMIGNPYPSPISLNSFYTSNSSVIANNFAFWNPATQGYAQYSSGGGWINNGTAGSNDKVALGQGFFVWASSNGSVSFTNAMRSSTQAFTFFSEPNKKLRMSVSQNGMNDETLIIENTSASNNLGDEDAKKYLAYMENRVSIATMIENSSLAINGFNNIYSTTEIPLQIISSANGKLQIMASEIEGFSGLNPMIHDAVKNVYYPLIKGMPCELDVQAGNCGSRFSLVFERKQTRTTNSLINKETFVQQPNKLIFNKSVSNVRITDMAGSMVLNQNLLISGETINTENIPSGIYLISYEVAGVTETVKVPVLH